MLKQREFCNYLIKHKLVKPYDVIKHSYCTSRLKDKKLRVETNAHPGVCPTITKRCDALGVVVYDE